MTVLATLLGFDPIDWLLASGEPSARYVALTELLGRGSDDPDVLAARAAVLVDSGTLCIVNRLPDWERDAGVSGHNSPGYAPNLLILLHRMGVRYGDFRVVDRTLRLMLDHQDDWGRFMSFGRSGHGSGGRLDEPCWGSLLCDHHAIVEVLLRFGLAADSRVQAGLSAILRDMSDTPQGRAWPCYPHSVSGFRGPGRKADFCPQVTAEALRAFALAQELAGVAAADGGAAGGGAICGGVANDGAAGSVADGSVASDETQLIDFAFARACLLPAAHALLAAWTHRGEAKPYMFGHGLHFKVVKWPPFWYDAFAVTSAICHYPEVWGPEFGNTESRQATSELVACLIAYNVGPYGRVTPGSCYKGFEQFSFGQKKSPSAFATAVLAAVVQRFATIAEDILGVNIRSLTSSKGGSGIARPPKSS